MGWKDAPIVDEPSWRDAPVVEDQPPIVAAPKPPTPLETAQGYLKNYLSSIVGTGEGIVSLGSQAIAAPISFGAGAAGAILPGERGQGADYMGRVQNALTYEPVTQQGKDITRIANIPGNLLAQGQEWAGRKTTDITGSPEAGALVHGAIGGVAAAVPFLRRRVAPAVEAPLAAGRVEPTLGGIPASSEPSMGPVAGAITEQDLLDPRQRPQAPATAPAAAVAGPNILQDYARGLMQSAIKPDRRMLKTGDAAIAIDTMLEKGFNVTKGGVEKIKTKISTLNDQITKEIADSDATISKKKAGETLLTTLDAFKMQVDSTTDVAAIEKTWKNFTENPLLPQFVPERMIPAKTVETGILDAKGNPFVRTIPEKMVPASGSDQIPVQTAQAMKQGTYRQLKKKYGEMGSADVEAQKGLARGLKEGIAEAVPKIGPLNAEENKLLTTLNVVEQRVLMNLNKDQVGLGWLANNPKAWAAFVADRSAAFKSLLARMIYSGVAPAVQGAKNVLSTTGVQAAPGVLGLQPPQVESF